MKFRIKSLTISFLIFPLFLISISFALTGSGSEADPYLITSIEDFIEFSNDPNFWEEGIYTQLECDLDLDPNLPGRKLYISAIIAPDTNSVNNMFDGVPFMGRFDGKGHIVSNIVIDAPLMGSECVGLFGSIKNPGEVKNIGIESFYISGEECIGGLAGANSGSISNCYTNGHVSGKYDIGMLVGINYSGSIADCYSLGLVDCEFYGGGLVGYSVNSHISSCYSACLLDGFWYGGLVGSNWNSQITNSFWDIDISNTDYSGGGLGLATSDLMNSETFSYNGWSGEFWKINDGLDYPHLIWESTPGSPLTDPVITFSGSGTAQDPYLLQTPNDILQICKGSIFWDKHFRMENNINLSGTEIKPIGYGRYNSFNGVFDGDGFKLNDPNILEYSSSIIPYGLFGYIGINGIVENLWVENIHLLPMKYHQNIGGLAGVNNGTIKNCVLVGIISSNNVNSLGGLTGSNGIEDDPNGILRNSCVLINLNGGFASGGLTGINYGTIESCFAVGEVFGLERSGGLVGQNGDYDCTSSIIENSYSLCEVSEGSYRGGIAGYSFGRIENCYSQSYLGAYISNIGSLIGFNDYGCIDNLVYNSEISHNPNGIGGGIWDPNEIYAFTSSQLRQPSSFLGIGWDFAGDPNDGNEEIWRMPITELNPVLNWQTVYSLQVFGGTGTGLYSQGELVNIEAEVPSGETFKSWSGDINYIDDPNNAITVVIMPDSYICIDPVIYYSGGAGTSIRPFKIQIAEDLNEIHYRPEHWDRYFIMISDVNMIDYIYEKAVIAYDVNDVDKWSNGIGDFQGTEFSGEFYGNGYSISNLIIYGEGRDYLGMFGKISGGLIDNLELHNLEIVGNDYSAFLGGIAGSTNYSDVLNCKVSLTMTGRHYMGGIIGSNHGNIEACRSQVSIHGLYDSSNIGGLAGSNQGYIKDCSSVGSILGEDQSEELGGSVGHNSNSIHTSYSSCSVDGYAYIGGLVGDNYQGEIVDCYSYGNVTADVYCGGLVGFNTWGIIRNSYSLGTAFGNYDWALGGLVGYNYGGGISSSFWDINTSGLISSQGGVGYSTEQMQTESIYIGWGQDEWIIDEGDDYPRLIWEGTDGTIINNIPVRSYSGSGTEQEPFLITSCADFLNLSARQEDWDKWFELGNNIDLGELNNYIPPGNFNGVLNGKNCTLSNYQINMPGVSLLGLFGCLWEDGKVLNLNLQNINIQGHSQIGGLIGLNKGLIYNCHIDGAIEGNSTLGGVVGRTHGDSIKNCSTSITISGRDYLGGVAGWNGTFSEISGCCSSGMVNCIEDDAGGFVGFNRGTISNCYSEVDVFGDKYLGGFTGYIQSGDIINCYSNGYINANNFYGGFVGKTISGSVVNSFWDIDTSGLTISDGGTGLNTYQMQDPNTFFNSDWDLVGENTNGTNDIWRMCINDVDYPRLFWEFSQLGDFACPDGVGMDDLIALCQNWLDSEEFDLSFNYPCDPTFDGITNLSDFDILAEHWLEE